MRRAIKFRYRNSVILLTLMISTIHCCFAEIQSSEHEQKRPVSLSKERDGVQFLMELSSDTVDYKSNIRLDLSITAPNDTETVLPDIKDRLQGFILEGSYDDEPATVDGKTTITSHCNLTPVVGRKYRIAPIAVTYTYIKDGKPSSGWFPSDPFLFKVISSDVTANDISDNMKSIWVAPSFKVVLIWTLAVIAALVLLFVIIIAARKINRDRKLRQLSPRERALLELKDLLAKKLIENHKTKDFYVELTMVVRRYIERAHSIKAPEQTTQEFLLHIVDNKYFEKDTVDRLQSFLEAADLVKFAGVEPDETAVNNSINTARSYIETDSEEIKEADNA